MENNNENINGGKSKKKAIIIVVIILVIVIAGILALVLINKNKENLNETNTTAQDQMGQAKEENQKTITKEDLVGNWKPTKATDKQGNEVSVRVIFGSAYSSASDALKINNDGTYTYYMGASAGDGSEEGTYVIEESSVKFVNKLGDSFTAEINVKDNGDIELIDNSSDRVGELFVVYFSKGEIIEDTNQDSSNNENFDSSKLVGEWQASKATDKQGNEVNVRAIFGSAYSSTTDRLKLKADGTYTYYMGASAGDGSEEGTYSVSGNIIKFVNKLKKSFTANIIVKDNGDVEIRDNGSDRIGDNYVYFTKSTSTSNNTTSSGTNNSNNETTNSSSDSQINTEVIEGADEAKALEGTYFGAGNSTLDYNIVISNAKSNSIDFSYNHAYDGSSYNRKLIGTAKYSTSGFSYTETINGKNYTISFTFNNESEINIIEKYDNNIISTVNLYK